MSLRKIGTLIVCLTALAGTSGALGADAQEPTVVAAPVAAGEIEGGTPHYIRPETPEQRRLRIATPTDPGLNPDPSEVFWRHGRQFTIAKVKKEDAKYMAEGWVRPTAFMAFEHEIYQENDRYIWVWVEKAPELTEEEKEPDPGYTEYSPEMVGLFEFLRDDFRPIEPEASTTAIRFEESSKGLPVSGSWRNGPDVGDMNGDGHADLVLPPQRGVQSFPSIYLGDGKGGWTRWPAKWSSAAFNYGTAAVGDFNRDKKMDVAFGVHLTGIAVFLGDGAGNFRRVVEGLDVTYPTRRVIVTDVDHDGWSDVVAISEGPVGRGDIKRPDVLGNLVAFMNRGKGEKWEVVNIAQPKEYIGADWLADGDFNGDKLPDFVGGTVYFNSNHTVYLSKGREKYDVYSDPAGKTILPRSYYHAVTTGKFSGGKNDEAIVAFIRTWPANLDPKIVPSPADTRISGFDRLSFSGGKITRTPIVRWPGKERLAGAASGDFNGDGKLDFAYSRHEPRELVLLLGDGKGGFTRATVKGVDLSGLRNYDLKAADVNGDKRPDLVIMYEAQEGTAFSPKRGSVQVFLNRGAEPVAQAVGNNEK